MLRKLTLTVVATVALCSAVATSAFAAAEFATKGACDNACRDVCFMVRGGDAWRCYWLTGNPNPPRKAFGERAVVPDQSRAPIPMIPKRP